MYLLGAAGVAPQHAAQRAMQPRNRVMVPSRGLSTTIEPQVQPVDRGSRGQGPGQHAQLDSSLLHLRVL